jgi:chaperonin GroEL (HSP60 family)
MDALRSNILAIRVVAETVKTTLGPKGMDKMLVTGTKEVAITDKGATILSLIDVKHPAAKMLVEAATAQGMEAGDGTSTVVVLVGELLKKAEELLAQGLHPAVIVEGYRLAHEEALKHLDDAAFPLDNENLLNIATTILMGKVGDDEAEHLSRIAVRAVRIAGDEENVKILHRPGGSIKDTQLIEGMVIDLGKRVHPAMPKRVENARILLIDTEFVVKDVDKVKIELHDPAKMRAFMEYKSRVLKTAVNMIAASGANVVLCHKNIEDLAMFFLAQAGILGVRDVDKDVLKMLAKATGGRIVSNVRDIDADAIGYAGLVEESKIGLEELMYVTKCRNPKAAAILVRGGTENAALETSKKLESLVAALSKVINEQKCISGGGACELEISRKLRKFVHGVDGKRQLAVEAYAEALEVIPRALAANAGMDPLITLTQLRARHEKRKPAYGLDGRDRKLKDTREAGIVESILVKKQALSIASELANMILRIDEVLMSKGFTQEEEEEVHAPKPQMPSTPEGAMDFPAKGGKIDFRGLMG